MRYLRQLLWFAVIAAGMIGLVAVTRPTDAEAVLPYLAAIPLILASWVVVDARRIRLRQYQTSLAWHPALLFVLAALIPIAVVPWYLTVRERILGGRTPLKPRASVNQSASTDGLRSP